jgi:hypothetical protein
LLLLLLLLLLLRLFPLLLLLVRYRADFALPRGSGLPAAV